MAFFILSIPGFIALSEFLFYKTNLAPYVYLFISIFVLFSMVDESRLTFLRLIYNRFSYYQIRVIETLIIASPFIVFLIYKEAYWCAIGLSIASTLVIMNKGNNLFNVVLSTPFGKYPFEFITGFRKYFLIIALTYFTLIMGISVNNYELSLFSMVAQALITVFFYNWIEPKEYVTIHSMSSTSFLTFKLWIALRQLFKLMFIPLLVVIIFFASQWWVTTVLFFACYLYLATVIASKYSYYPDEINLIQALLLGLAVFMPPMIIILLPYYLVKAKANINTYLSI